LAHACFLLARKAVTFTLSITQPFGLVNNGCLALELAKKQIKTGYDFHSGCTRNQSMYSVIARSISVLGTISHFFSDRIDTAV